MNFFAADTKTFPSSFKDLLNRYQQTARKKKLIWDLKVEDFAKIINKPCDYCGVAPFERYNVYITKEDSYRQGNTKRMDKGWILYNGIDRVDNNLGYVSNNVVPCCKWCNYAKNNRSREEFIAWTELFRGRLQVIN